MVVPIEAVILMIWWLWEARGWNPEGWLNPFLPESVGTVLLQWGVALVALVALQRWLDKSDRLHDSGLHVRLGWFRRVADPGNPQ